MKALAAILIFIPSLAWADCVQQNTGMVDCGYGPQSGYELGNSGNVFIPGTGIVPAQPEQQSPYLGYPEVTPGLPQPRSFDGSQPDD